MPRTSGVIKSSALVLSLLVAVARALPFSAAVRVRVVLLPEVVAVQVVVVEVRRGTGVTTEVIAVAARVVVARRGVEAVSGRGVVAARVVVTTVVVAVERGVVRVRVVVVAGRGVEAVAAVAAVVAVGAVEAPETNIKKR